MESATRQRLTLWAAFALLLLMLPAALSSEYALSVSTKMGIAIIFALSYNMLLGQGGMLSFGHAVYSGLGGYFAIHALAAINDGSFNFPVSLLPLVGGLAGMGFAMALGWVSTRRAGTTFAMISLGIGELVVACVLMIPAFFGGEAGVSANRVTGKGWFGINFATQLQMYYLIAAWTLVCAGAMYYITCTPFGRLANAVRDNPERVSFVGYSTHKVRYQVMVLSGLFAGVAGALAALNDEIVTIETVGAHASGLVLLMVFIGGMGHFIGPIIGAVVVLLLQTVVSSITHAWLFYFGALFLVMVLFAPGGFAGLLFERLPALRAPGGWKRAGPALARTLLALALVLAATILAVESAYHLWSGSAEGPMALADFELDPAAPTIWIAAAVLLMAGLAVLLRSSPPAAKQEAR